MRHSNYLKTNTKNLNHEKCKKSKKDAFLTIILFFICLFLVGCEILKKSDYKKIVFDIIDDYNISEAIDETSLIDFGIKKSSKYLLDGWAGNEKGVAVWANSISSQVKFYCFNTDSNKKLDLRCTPFTSIDLPKQHIKLFLNGNYIYTQELKKEWESYTFFLPKKHLKFGENFLTFEYKYIATLKKERKTKSRISRAVRFDWLRFAETAPGIKHIFKKKKAIYINPLSFFNYYLKVPEEAKLEFKLDVNDRKLLKNKGNFRFNIFIQEDFTEREKLFESNLKKPSVLGNKHEVDLSKYQNKIVRLTFKLNCSNKIGRESSKIYAKLIKPQIQGNSEKANNSDYRSLFKKMEGIDKTNLVIIILDAANPNHMGSYGYSRNTTPNLDKIAEESIIFINAFAQAPHTLQSTASLFTSTYPITHRVFWQDSFLLDKAITLAEVLKEKDYITFALTSNILASSKFNLFQGFDQYNELFKMTERDFKKKKKKKQVVWVEDFLKPIDAWLIKNKNKKFFIYLHLLQPHAPYNPPPPFKDTYLNDLQSTLDLKKNRRPFPSLFNEESVSKDDLEYIIASYDANLKYADFYLEKIIDQFKKKRIYENTIFVITADHGEAFLEHGTFQHSKSVYDEEIHIPLIIKFPNKYGLKKIKINALVQSIDLMPTFIELYGLNKNKYKWQGKSLVPLILNKRGRIHNFILASHGKVSFSGEIKAITIRDSDFKFIITENKKLLFDLKKDPGEKNNIYLRRPICSGYYYQNLLKLVDESLARESLASEAKTIIDKETKEHLRALGYIK